MFGYRDKFKTTDGRRFWYFEHFVIGLEVYWGKGATHCGIAVSSGVYGDTALMFHIGLPWLIDLYLWIDHRRFNHEREISVSFHHGSLWWRVWDDPSEWTRGKSRQYTWHIVDWIKGMCNHSTRTLSRGKILIPMLERSYQARYTEEETVWWRARWPGRRVVKRYNFEIEQGIPVPGKGENPWDLDDDAVMEISVNAGALHEAVASVVESVLRDRYRYGGLDWVPSSNAETVDGLK